MSAVARRSASVVLTPRGDVCCQDAGAELARDASTLDMKDNQSIVVHNSGRIGPIVMTDYRGWLEARAVVHNHHITST